MLFCFLPINVKMCKFVMIAKNLYFYFIVTSITYLTTYRGWVLPILKVR